MGLDTRHQFIATQYAYAYLTRDREQYISLLSRNLSAKVTRNGNLVFEGGKDGLVKYMDTGLFFSLEKCEVISLKILTAADHPVIKVKSLQSMKDDRKGTVEDTITFTVEAETGGVEKIIKVTHNYFPTTLAS